MKRTLNSLLRQIYRSRLTCLLVVLTIAVISQAFANTAYADTLTVTIRQVNPDSAPQTVTCTLLQENCDLPFVINAGTAAQQSLNIHVVYFTGGLALNFQTSGGYFYTANTMGKNTTYSTLWDRRFKGSAPVTFAGTLFQPLAPELLIGPAPNNNNYTPAANLEITATSGP